MDNLSSGVSASQEEGREGFSGIFHKFLFARLEQNHSAPVAGTREGDANL